MSNFDDLSREELVALVRQMAEQIAALQQEVETLRSQLRGRGPGNGLPPFVKPNRAQRRQEERKERKKRAQPCVRKREAPTERAPKAVEQCPDCGRKLTGGWVHDTRQLIELPETPIRVIEYRLIARRCGICRKVHIGKVGPEDGVVGKHRFGARFMSMVATLSIHCRMPKETIQGLLQSVYGVHVSTGEIIEILHAVAALGKKPVARLLEGIQQAPVVCGDETGWREDGENGYLWVLCTPETRYYQRDKSRAAAVSQGMLGDEFAGVLSTDFYSGYNWYLGPKQRCWVHSLRTLHELKEAHPNDVGVQEWARAITQTYERAKKTAAKELSPAQRRRYRRRYEDELLALARPYLGDKEAPQHTFAKRIENFHAEMFTFVEHSGVPSENNAAERAVRPAVIARKVSGGTRSPRGSETKCTLMSLVGTWKLRALDPLEEFVRLLTGESSLPEMAPT